MPWQYNFPSVELRVPNLFLHVKATSVKTWFAMVGLEELEWPEQSPDVNLTPSG